MTKRSVAALATTALVACLGGCAMTGPAGLPPSQGVVAGSDAVAVIYVRPGCSFCQEAREFFAARGLPVHERNVVADRGALVEMLDIHVRRFPDEEPIVPLIVIGDRAVRGFDQQEVEKALDEAGRKTESGSKP
ncbi:glutaredoxin family protein [Geobacter sp.]|uniref:glutaredoxin family protein n=1 Tax=Geobacter sp. TaxID=46610 RepID=UPI0027B8F8FD|nr:glutaredoxin family protein [Geobacter sp.]